MGILDKIKSIFAEKPAVVEKPQEQAVTISNLEAWFAEKEADIRRGTSTFMETIKPRFLEAVRSCGHAAAALRTAQPRYPQLYEQSKVIAEGNRSAFVVSTENFLKTLKFPDSPDDFSAFIKNSNSALADFMSSSNRSFIISNEFFTEQTVSIKKCMQDIDKILQESSKYQQDNKHQEFLQTKEKIAQTLQKIKLAQQLEAELNEIESKLKETKEQIDKTKQDLAELLQSPEFLNRQKLEIELKEIRVKIKLHEDEAHGIISVLDAPLKKLAWDNSAHKKLIELYSGDLADAILQDSKFKFGEILAKLKGAIDTGMVYAKDKRRNQASECINKLTKEFLQEWFAAYRGLKNKEASLRVEIETSEATTKESELKTKLQKLEHEQEVLNESHATIIRTQKRTDVDDEIKNLGSSLSLVFGPQIKLIKG